MKIIALSILLCIVIVKAEEAAQPALELPSPSALSSFKKQEKRGIYAGGYPTGAGGYDQQPGYYGAAATYNNPLYSPVAGATGYTSGYNTGLGTLGYNSNVGIGGVGYNPAYTGYTGYSGYPTNRVIGLGYNNGYSNGYNGYGSYYTGAGYNNGYYSRTGGNYPYTYNRYNTYSNYPVSGYAGVGSAYSGVGSGYAGVGSGYAGVGSGYSGLGSGYSGVGSGYSYGPGISGSIY